MNQEAHDLLRACRELGEREVRSLATKLGEVLGGQMRREAWHLSRAAEGLEPITDIAALRARLVAEEMQEDSK